MIKFFVVGFILAFMLSACSPKIQYIGIYQKKLPKIPIEKKLKAERRGHILIKKLRTKINFYEKQIDQNNEMLEDNNALAVE